MLYEVITNSGFILTLIQIALIDIVFSLDSVITAVGMASHLPVMILAIVLAVAAMMVAARPIGEFVDQHPTVKMLALSFLVLVGMTLIGEGFDLHIPVITSYSIHYTKLYEPPTNAPAWLPAT